MGGRRFVVTVLAGLLLALISLPAYGATFGGTVSSNAYADSIFWGYDDDVVLLPPSSGTLYNSDIASFFVEFYNSGVRVDDLSFYYADRQEGSDYPHIYANVSAEPIGVVYYSDTFDGTTISSVSLGIYLEGENTIYKIYGNGGELITGNLEFTPIPIPSAMWLLGSGLACLVGLKRRFRTSE
jgi:hypothetical protein